MCGNCMPINMKTANALNNFSGWLAKQMVLTGTKDEDIAQYLGMTRKTVLEIRLGRRFPKLDQVVMIFDYFGKNNVIIPFDREINYEVH